MQQHSHGASGHHRASDHDHGSDAATSSPAVDLQIPDSELSPSDLGRRGFLRRAGLLGATAAAGSVLGSTLPAAADDGRERGQDERGGRYQWLAGDHLITDHGSITHAKIGVEVVNPDIVTARALCKDQTLVFPGLEWNIPAAEHGTIIVHPGTNEVAVLKEFENGFDGVGLGGAAVDPRGPLADLKGDADPWDDPWFYTNPIWVIPS